MKRYITSALAFLLAFAIAEAQYIPTEENLRSRREFVDAGFGVFIHWGIYSMFAQGEWYLNSGISAEEYAKAASAFYPARFDAASWVKDIKDAGAKYITITSRHHDGFSMFGTRQSPYNIVDSTPFGRDVIKELADECHKQGIRLHLYYSHIDWGRPDYPKGRTGLKTGCRKEDENWEHYYDFMNNQLTELLTNYGEIGAIWFDGYWDHDSDSVPFDWQLEKQYAMIHRLQPGCLVGNNHHIKPFEGEDIQIFERDIPGQNEAGLSGQEISHLPLETCQTMNGMWGYKVKDTDYKSVNELIHLLVRCSGMGANLLLNIGPQPDGRLPQQSLERLKGIGEWMKTYGTTIYDTQGGPVKPQPWGAVTRRDNTLFVHVLQPDSIGSGLFIPGVKGVAAKEFSGGSKVRLRNGKEGMTLYPDRAAMKGPDYVVEVRVKK
mgnify:CR=1 FL=1